LGKSPLAVLSAHSSMMKTKNVGQQEFEVMSGKTGLVVSWLKFVRFSTSFCTPKQRTPRSSARAVHSQHHRSHFLFQRIRFFFQFNH
jgi:hypothetical protein